MWRMAAFGLLSVASIVGAGGLYQVHHLIVLNFELWPTLKTIRDLTLILVALLMLFYPSRLIVGTAMASVFILPFLVSLNPPGPFYVCAAAGGVGLAALATHARRGIPSPFTTDQASSADRI